MYIIYVTFLYKLRIHLHLAIVATLLSHLFWGKGNIRSSAISAQNFTHLPLPPSRRPCIHNLPLGTSLLPLRNIWERSRVSFAVKSLRELGPFTELTTDTEAV